MLARMYAHVHEGALARGVKSLNVPYKAASSMQARTFNTYSCELKHINGIGAPPPIKDHNMPASLEIHALFTNVTWILLEMCGCHLG